MRQAALTQVLAEFDAAPADQRTIVALRNAIAARVYTKSFLDYGEGNFEMRYFITHQDKYQVCAPNRRDSKSLQVNLRFIFWGGRNICFQ